MKLVKDKVPSVTDWLAEDHTRSWDEFLNEIAKDERRVRGCSDKTHTQRGAIRDVLDRLQKLKTVLLHPGIFAQQIAQAFDVRQTTAQSLLVGSKNERTILAVPFPKRKHCETSGDNSTNSAKRNRSCSPSPPRPSGMQKETPIRKLTGIPAVHASPSPWDDSGSELMAALVNRDQTEIGTRRAGSLEQREGLAFQLAFDPTTSRQPGFITGEAIFWATGFSAQGYEAACRLFGTARRQFGNSASQCTEDLSLLWIPDCILTSINLHNVLVAMQKRIIKKNIAIQKSNPFLYLAARSCLLLSDTFPAELKGIIEPAAYASLRLLFTQKWGFNLAEPEPVSGKNVPALAKAAADRKEIEKFRCKVKINPAKSDEENAQRVRVGRCLDSL
ncbi:hypothetical protein HDU90_006417 [Geranomyces variabilis]|nr:hypothetical protein HDU90_006417 [Geranomyces variabilis]